STTIHVHASDRSYVPLLEESALARAWVNAAARNIVSRIGPPTAQPRARRSIGRRLKRRGMGGPALVWCRGRLVAWSESRRGGVLSPLWAGACRGPPTPSGHAKPKSLWSSPPPPYSTLRPARFARPRQHRLRVRPGLHPARLENVLDIPGPREQFL